MKTGRMILGIDSIKVGENRRTLRNVEALAESIKEVGLLQPIVVLQDMRLIAGHHRIEAYKILDRHTIEANVVAMSDVDAQLAEIDENLTRHDLTVLERAEHLAKRKGLYEAKHPETRNGGDRRSKNQFPESGNRSPVPSFVASAQKLTGAPSSSTIYEEIKIANKLADDVKEEIKGLPIADNKRQLTELSNKTFEKQRESVEMIKAGRSLAERPPSVLNTKRPKGPKTPKREAARIRIILGHVHQVRAEWASLVLEWNDAQRLDMLWAVQKSGAFVGTVDEMIAWLDAVIQRCEASPSKEAAE